MNESNEPQLDDSSQAVTREEQIANSTLVTRSVFGGVLMGLANLVPGISGGTMLLAAGIYPKFIEAISDITRLRFRFQSILVLGCIVASAGLGILLLAGTLKDLVVDHRWIMYSLFIGLTLGGLPVVWKLAKPGSKRLYVAAFISFAAMCALAYLQASGVMGNNESSMPMMFVAGLAGASAMILPGVSGGYLLLLLGQYVPILAGIDDFKTALKARDFSMLMDPLISVVIPVGIGVVIGVIVVGNLLQYFLRHHRQATLGALLGLLVGSTVGLWPFQQPVEPEIGQVIKGSEVTAETLPTIEQDDWPTEYFKPSIGQIGGSLGLVVIGFALTLGIAKIGGDDKEEETS